MYLTVSIRSRINLNDYIDLSEISSIVVVFLFCSRSMRSLTMRSALLITSGKFNGVVFP